MPLFRPSPFAATTTRPVLVATPRPASRIVVSADTPGVRTYDARGEVRFKGVDIWASDIRTSFAVKTARHLYPYVAGQTIEDLGSAPAACDVTAEFFGVGWQDRKANLLHLLRSDRTAGWLEIPDSVSFAAVLESAEEQRDPTMDGCTVSLHFEQDSHLDWHDTVSADDIRSVWAALPVADESALSPTLTPYTEAIEAPGSTSPEEKAALLAAFEAAVQTQQQALDMTALAGVDRYDGLLLARYRARLAAFL